MVFADAIQCGFGTDSFNCARKVAAAQNAQIHKLSHVQFKPLQHLYIYKRCGMTLCGVSVLRCVAVCCSDVAVQRNILRTTKNLVNSGIYVFLYSILCIAAAQNAT